ncbi:hypothetical protein [Kordiimonas sp.]|uniref:hypothetical protein n=1 Tax=Kordiimonas sp. TaxID=1970157 RepID=UPI003A8F95D6
MLRAFTSTALLFSALTMSGASLAGNDPSIPVGPYLGQTPPGLTPEVFAPGIVSKEHRELSGFFAPDMKEYYFTKKTPDDGKWWLVTMKQENGRWHEAGVTARVGRPILTPDGKTMLLDKQYRERTESGWSEVKSLGPFFEDIRIMRLTASANGTYVLDEATRDGKGVLRASRLMGGEREAPKPLPDTINTGTWNAHPFIAPDESYIIWDGERESGQGDSDLYISFRQEDGSWGDAINMGDEVNTAAMESGAYVSPDGNYLFFNRNVSHPDSADNIDIFWVDAQVIKYLRPKPQ